MYIAKTRVSYEHFQSKYVENSQKILQITSYLRSFKFKSTKIIIEFTTPYENRLFQQFKHDYKICEIPKKQTTKNH